jgi:hypothetical protein
MFKLQTRLPIGYLWKKRDGKGGEYLGGVLSLGFFEIPIVIFPERPDRAERAADFVIKIPPPDRTQRPGE